MVSESSMGFRERLVEIPIGQWRLKGILVVPREVRAGVVFAHGSGSSRLSPRNQSIARVLEDAGLATLRFDLLEERRPRTGASCTMSSCWRTGSRPQHAGSGGYPS